MKTLLLTASFASLLMGGGASAETTTQTQQQGDNNNIIAHSGHALESYVKITQVGDGDYAEAYTSGQRQSVEIRQQNASGSEASLITGMVGAVSANSHILIDQTGSHEAGALATVVGDGNQLNLTQTQSGTAHVDTYGDANIVNIVQTGTWDEGQGWHELEVAQQGDANQAVVQQTAANDVGVVTQGASLSDATSNGQSSSGNFASLFQTADNDYAELHQWGDQNFGTVVQSGAANIAWLTQEGGYDTASVIQMGSDNAATINQSGAYDVASLIQSGDNNLAEITQTGDGMHSVGQQIGNGNVLQMN